MEGGPLDSLSEPEGWQRVFDDPQGYRLFEILDQTQWDNGYTIGARQQRRNQSKTWHDKFDTSLEPVLQ